MNRNRLYDNDPTLWSNLMRAFYACYVECYLHKDFPLCVLDNTTFLVEDARSKAENYDDDPDDPERPYHLYFVRPAKVYGLTNFLTYSPLEQQIIGLLPSHNDLTRFCSYLNDAPLHFASSTGHDIKDVECWSDFVDFVIDNCIDDADELKDWMKKGGVEV